MSSVVYFWVLLAAVLVCCNAGYRPSVFPAPVGDPPCLPQKTARTFVRVRVIRAGFCADQDFMISMIRSNLPGNCSLLGIALFSCRETASRTFAEFRINVTCNEACVRYTTDEEALTTYNQHTTHLLQVVRSKLVTNMRQSGLRVIIMYFKKENHYQDVCPAGFLRKIRKMDLCICGNECDFSSLFNCSGDLVYKACGYISAETCQGSSNLPQRFPYCFEGCFCPDGLFRVGERCVPPTECPGDVCLLPSGAGTGRATVPRYYYNAANQRCEEFTYTGCGGNGNRFETRDRCQQRCSDPRCGGDMVYKECGAFCGVTCENYFSPPHPKCDETCLQGCFCPDGLIPLREGSSECVLPQECPSPQCPGDKALTTCGSACPRTCDNLDEGGGCIEVCVPGCFCPDGLIELGDRCVPPAQCPNDTCLLPPVTGPCEAAMQRYFYNSTTGRCEQFTYGGCDGNENNFETVGNCQQRCSDPRCRGDHVYKECGSHCGSTCQNLHGPQPVCTEVCIEGCFCSDGLIPLNSSSSQCFYPVECPPPQCPGDKVFTTCGTACPRTCENKDDNISCTLQCVPGCFCPDGLVELGDRCVPPGECPNDTCLLPPVTGPCRAFIPRYFYNDTAQQCEMFIYGSCGGNENNFQTLGECQQMRTECPEGKVFMECGTACPPTCGNQHDVTVCTLPCVAGCQCLPGTLELEDRCVAPEDCPAPQIDCHQDPDPGPCRAFLPSWFYNSTSGQCQDFVYGGCGGNDNRFCSEEECHYICQERPVVDCRLVECPPLDPPECTINPPVPELGICCPTCVNCAAVLCRVPECENPIPADLSIGRCCPTCPDNS